MGPRTYFSAAALSPSGELWASASVDYRTVRNPADGSSFVVATEALVSVDRSGNLLSTNRLTGVNSEVIAFDRAGNRYMTGYFDTNRFWLNRPQDLTNFAFNAAEVRGFFVAKYDPNDNLLWVRSEDLQDSILNVGRALVVDAAGSVVVGGTSYGPMNLGSFSFSDGVGPFICKSSGDGQLIWAKRFADAGGFGGIAVDADLNIIVSGFVSQTIQVLDFDGVTLFPGVNGHSYGDFFLAKFLANGALAWVQLGYGGTIATDKIGNIYTSFTWAKELVSSGIGKFSPSGDLLWSKGFPGVWFISGVSLDSDDAPVFTGSFADLANLDSWALKGHNIDWEDFFIAKADDQANIVWAIAGGGPRLDRAMPPLCDGHGNIFLVGSTEGSGFFDAFPLRAVSDGTSYFFAAKLNPAPLLNISPGTGASMLSWPLRATNYILESASSLSASTWEVVTNSPVATTTNRSVQLPITGGAKLFRLRKP